MIRFKNIDLLKKQLFLVDRKTLGNQRLIIVRSLAKATLRKRSMSIGNAVDDRVEGKFGSNFLLGGAENDFIAKELEAENIKGTLKIFKTEYEA